MNHINFQQVSIEGEKLEELAFSSCKNLQEIPTIRCPALKVKKKNFIIKKIFFYSKNILLNFFSPVFGFQQKQHQRCDDSKSERNYS
jgi:hypothetical protein